MRIEDLRRVAHICYEHSTAPCNAMLMCANSTAHFHHRISRHACVCISSSTLTDSLTCTHIIYAHVLYVYMYVYAMDILYSGTSASCKWQHWRVLVQIPTCRCATFFIPTQEHSSQVYAKQCSATLLQHCCCTVLYMCTCMYTVFSCMQLPIWH